MDDETKWLRLAEAAEVAGVGRSTLDDHARAGEVPYATMGGQRFFLREVVEVWARARRAEQPEVAA